jgi:hypothetical protein
MSPLAVTPGEPVFWRAIPDGARRMMALGAILGWMACASVGLAALAWYAHTPGQPGRPPRHWPRASRIIPAGGHANLVMLLHPRCPCSRASVEELDRLIARVGHLVRVHVLVLKPRGASDDWEKTDLWRNAAAIPGVAVHTDRDGVEARRFRAETSGQVVLYDGSGDLVFSGGITPARGHAGDSAGRDTIIRLLTEHDRLLGSTAAVFGCSLFRSNDAI